MLIFCTEICGIGFSDIINMPEEFQKNRWSRSPNRLLFSELANIEFTCPENSNWWLLLPDSNLFLKFQNNFTAEF